MGYTHYMYIKRNGPQEQWSAAVLAASEIIRKSPIPLGDMSGDGDGPIYTDEAIYANGAGGDEFSHETLTIYTTLSALGAQPWRTDPDDGRFFEFCKTAYKPYDVVVTAVYATLEALAPDCCTVSSDGGREDWIAGTDLASSVLGRVIPIPVFRREDDDA